ncbi:MAG: aldose 1-epimerase family protein [Bacteroidales bacterium]|nr:aldose 1-epimerase family protein [Bacteroidales bacterium]
MTRNEIMQYTGNQSQIGGSRNYVLTDGWGRNLRGIDVNSGSGFQYTILPDRGMDISLASYKGSNLVYLTCNGETHPAFYEPENLGWLRTFTGGLLTTCGLINAGAAEIDEGEQFGLHGRYSTLPARQVSDLSDWFDDEYLIKHRGIIEEGVMFGYKLRMEREITTVLGHNSLKLMDKVTNFGNKPSPYTIIYHMNIGYPLLSEDAELIIDPASTEPKDNRAASGINEYKRFSKPQKGYEEQVFIHTMKSDASGKTMVTLQNRNSGIALTIKYNAVQLPYLWQWKMMGQGDYVLGLEPSNLPCKSRRLMKEENILPHLEPGESVTNEIEVIISEI